MYLIICDYLSIIIVGFSCGRMIAPTTAGREASRLLAGFFISGLSRRKFCAASIGGPRAVEPAVAGLSSVASAKEEAMADGEERRLSISILHIAALENDTTEYRSLIPLS
ncbi:MAG TPA: hypothetical protein VM163_04255 [bacterium]|nr:hypothetical protein [bacterium]